MRVSIICDEDTGTRYAFGSSPQDVTKGHLPYRLSPETALYAAAGFPQGSLITDQGEAHVLLVANGNAGTWKRYRAENVGGWTCMKVQAWTRWSHRDHPDTHVWVFLPALASDEHWPLVMRADGYSGDLVTDCTRLLSLGEMMGHPWVLTAGHTAHLVMREALRPDPDARGVRADRRIEPYWYTNGRWDFPPQMGGDLLWQRAPLKSEAGGFVIGYDLNAARLAALGVVELAAGKLERRGPIGFDPTLAGYWFVDRSSLNRRHYRTRRDAPPLIDEGGEAVTTPIMAEWMRQGILPAVTDCLVAPGKRLFRTLAGRWDHARRGAIDTVYEASVKAFYRAGTGLLASPGGLIYRPDWYHATMDRQRVTLLTHANRIHQRTGKQPLRVHTDCLWYATETDDARAFADAAGINIGQDEERHPDPRALGLFKVHSVQPFTEVYRKAVA